MARVVRGRRTTYDWLGMDCEEGNGFFVVEELDLKRELKETKGKRKSVKRALEQKREYQSDLRKQCVVCV